MNQESYHKARIMICTIVLVLKHWTIGGRDHWMVFLFENLLWVLALVSPSTFIQSPSLSGPFGEVEN